MKYEIHPDGTMTLNPDYTEILRLDKMLTEKGIDHTTQRFLDGYRIGVNFNGREIGQCYIFTLRNGHTVPIIMADFKHPIDNIRADDYGDDDINYDGQNCINIIEFIVDMAVIPEHVKKAGTMSALECFGGLYGTMGDIVNVEPCGRRWKP